MGGFGKVCFLACRDYRVWIPRLEAGGEGTSPFPFFYRRGRLLERNAVIALWDEDRQLILNDDCGIRLQGDGSRASVYKRFRLIARKIYSGSSTFSASLFGDLKCHTFFTRQDTTDIIAQKLVADRGLGGLDALPAAVFINGEYYYTTYLRERYDPLYFTNHFDVEEDDLVLISNETLDRGTEADYEEYCALMDYIAESDCSDPAVYAEICSKIDVQSYADYVAVNLYCDNTDWSIFKNYKVWRTRNPLDDGFRDGRWRWLVYDMDGCAWCARAKGFSSAEYDPFQILQPYTQVSFLEMPLFKDLIKNPDFRQTFITSWLDLMNVNFRLETVMPLLAQYGEDDGSFWTSFLPRRTSYAVEILIRNLELDAEACELTLRTQQPEGGRILLNTVRPDLSEGNWTGTYLTGVPITLTAEPAEGWRFVGWSGAAEGAENSVTLTLTGDAAVTAVFARD